MSCTFSNNFIWIKPRSLFSAFTIHMLDFLKLIKFNVLLYFDAPINLKKWLIKKSLTRYQVYSRLKTVTKTFLEKCNMLLLNRHVALLCCTFSLSLQSKIKTWKIWERLIMMRKSLQFTNNQITRKWNNKFQVFIGISISFYRHYHHRH